ncbi:MAG: hypothetical protein K9N06_06485 [Candidatus Cloacimonetes bacterium]|nr:hypothetical protein [Candidatus Cloacimonadota bacterium]
MKKSSGGLIVEIDRENALRIIDKAARFIVERKLSPAAIMTIESLRPLNFIASQFMYMVAPFAELFFSPREYQEFAALLENDEYIKLLMERIDELDAEIWREEHELRVIKRKLSREKRKIFFKKIFKK